MSRSKPVLHFKVDPEISNSLAGVRTFVMTQLEGC